MKYILLKTSCLLCIRLEEESDEVEIRCFDRRSQVDDYLSKNDASPVPLPLFRIDLDRIGQSAPPGIVQDGFFIRYKDSLRKIPFDSIMWIEAARNYASLHLRDGKKVLVAHTLHRIRSILPAATFVSVHRSYLVNVHHVTGFLGNTVIVRDAALPVSKPCRRSLYSRFLFLDSLKHRDAAHTARHGKKAVDENALSDVLCHFQEE